MDAGPAAISDADELAQVRRQARGVYLKSLLAALVLTAVAVVL